MTCMAMLSMCFAISGLSIVVPEYIRISSLEGDGFMFHSRFYVMGPRMICHFDNKQRIPYCIG